jgi:uncharacterized membrane protein YbjE (DUF340 family)
MSAALHSIVRLMAFNSKVEQIESRTASLERTVFDFRGSTVFTVALIFHVILQFLMSGLRYPGMLHGVGWYSITDVSVQHIGPILKNEAVIIGFFFTLEDGFDTLSRNVCNQLPPYTS